MPAGAYLGNSAWSHRQLVQAGSWCCEMCEREGHRERAGRHGHSMGGSTAEPPVVQAACATAIRLPVQSAAAAGEQAHPLTLLFPHLSLLPAGTSTHLLPRWGVSAQQGDLKACTDMPPQAAEVCISHGSRAGCGCSCAVSSPPHSHTAA